MNLVEFSLAIDIVGLGNCGRRGSSHQSIHQGRAIRDREKQRGHMPFIFYFGNLLVFGHGQGHVENFIVGLRVCIDFNELLSLKVIEITFVTNRRFNLPGLWSCVLNCDFLRNFLPDHTVKLELLNSILRLGYAFSDQVDIERVSTLNRAFNFELDIVVWDVRVERYVEE